jgi:hypothetical protein
MAKQPNPSDLNQGIQAGSVVADVLAVGPNASAQKNVGVREIQEEYLKAVTQLRLALDALALPPADKQLLVNQIDKLASGSTASKPDRSGTQPILKAITDILQSAGLAIKNIADLCDPITKIATLVAIPLHMIGL